MLFISEDKDHFRTYLGNLFDSSRSARLIHIEDIVNGFLRLKTNSSRSPLVRESHLCDEVVEDIFNSMPDYMSREMLDQLFNSRPYDQRTIVIYGTSTDKSIEQLEQFGVLRVTQANWRDCYERLGCGTGGSL